MDARIDIIERTYRWMNEFVEQFVVAPTADAPDFARQSMPRLESLAYLFNQGMVDEQMVWERLNGDLSAYKQELEFFLLSHEENEETFGKSLGTDYKQLRRMFGIGDYDERKRETIVVEVSQRAEERKAQEQVQKQALVDTLRQMKARNEELSTDDNESVAYQPSEALYQEFEKLFGTEPTEPEDKP